MAQRCARLTLTDIYIYNDQLHELECVIGITFEDRTLLQLAMTHQSYVNEHPGETNVSNERLEFLGDSVVGMVVADRLYRCAPDLPEGDLTVRRSQVVRRDTLAAAARKFDLGRWLIMGKGEASAGGSDRQSNLADAFEAIVGAIFLDRGYSQAEVFVLTWLSDFLNDAIMTETRKDPKSVLQELVQGRGVAPPRYVVIAESGTPESRVFTTQVLIDGKPIATGTGSRKIDAERESATKALEVLETSK